MCMSALSPRRLGQCAFGLLLTCPSSNSISGTNRGQYGATIADEPKLNNFLTDCIKNGSQGGDALPLATGAITLFRAFCMWSRVLLIPLRHFFILTNAGRLWCCCRGREGEFFYFLFCPAHILFTQFGHPRYAENDFGHIESVESFLCRLFPTTPPMRTNSAFTVSLNRPLLVTSTQVGPASSTPRLVFFP